MSQAKATEVMSLINGAMKKNVVTLGSDPKYVTRVLPTGVLPIDILLQGGFARGRMTAISGTWSALKTVIALRACGTTQRGNEMAGFIDAERTYDREWAAQCGVDTKSLLYVRPAHGEEAFDALEAMVRAGVPLVVVDSVAALLPQSEREKALSDEKIQPGRLAALMSAGLRKVTTANSDTAIVWLNQTRMQIGMTFGNPEHPAGGKALPFYLSQHIVMSKTGRVTNPAKYWDGESWKDGKLAVAQKFKAQLEKSKLNMPQREVNFVWDFRSAEIDLPGFLIGQGLEQGTIRVKGNTWQYGPVKAIGRQKFYDALAADEESMRHLETAVRLAHQMPLNSSRGHLPRRSEQDAEQSPAKRSGTGRVSTRAAGRAASSSTRRPTKKSTSSSARTAASPSKRRTS